MKQQLRFFTYLVLALCIAFQFAYADTVYLKNGDVLNGAITSAEDGKIIISPDFAKDTSLKISLSDISSFKTVAPLLIKLKDGTVINQMIKNGKSGTIETAPGGTLAAQPIPLDKIDKINPNYAWNGAVGVNGMYASSNTITTTMGLSADGTRRSDYDRITANGSYNFGEQRSNGRTTINSDNWAAEGAYDYFVSKDWYSYADLKFGGDHVNHLSLRFTPSIGAGYQWFDQGNFHISTEGGAAMIYQDYSTANSATKDIAARFAYHLDKSWDDDRIKVLHNVSYLPSLQQNKEFLVQTDAALRVSLTKSMYSEVKGIVNYDNNPPAQTKSTTTQVLVGLGLTY